MGMENEKHHRMKSITVKYLWSFMVFLCFVMATNLNAQITRINGTVNDDSGQPVQGVIVSSGNSRDQAITDKDGAYLLNLDDRSGTVRFSCLGYQSQVLVLESEEVINVELRRAETYNLDEPVRLGYTTQRRGSLTGSVVTVNGKELEHSPAPQFSQALAGQLAGLYTYESYSEPSRATTTLRVRGANSIRANTPLVVIDGIPYTYNSSNVFEYVTASEVESVSVLKDASAQALYGISGANGVIVVTTKRGVQGKLKINVKAEQTFEQPSTRLPFLSSGEFVQLRNEAGHNDGLGEHAYFSSATVNGFTSGTNREIFPNNDWRKINMKDMTGMQRVNVDLTGGNGRAVFFTNLNVMHQDGMWKTDQTKYNPNNDFFWVNFRSNVDVKLNRFLSTSLNLSGNIKREKAPGSAEFPGYADGIYYRLYTVPSYVYGPVTPMVTDPDTDEILSEGGGVVVTSTEGYPAYAVINRLGYNQNTQTNIYAQSALKLDMSFLTQGLNLSGYVGYQTNYGNTLFSQQTFAGWVRTNDYREVDFTRYGTNEDTPLSNYKNTHFYYNLTFKGVMDYDRTFGLHHVSGLAFAFYQIINTDNTDSPALLPYKYLHSGLEAAYDYAGRYLLKFDLGYSGSEQYAKENRFTAIPAVSGGWVVSREAFMEGIPWLSLLKLRASYGKTANDRCGLGRYVYLDNITLGSGGALAGYLQYLVSEGQAANPYIEPEISVKQNYGVDLSLFDHISVSADIFRERMDNMVAGGISITPEYQGIPLNDFPRINSGTFENKGFELTADYVKAIRRDISFNVGGWLAYAKNTVIRNDESERAEDYIFRKREEGFPVGQQFGYLVDRHNGNGYFNSRQELDDSHLEYEIGTPRLGDLKYYDLNNDGIINDKDQIPLGHGSIPLYVYAFHAQLNYRNFDVSVLFQGVADYYHLDMQTGRTEYGFEGIYSEIHKQAWTAERYANGEKITYPALSTKANANHAANSFFLEDKSYLRLKNLVVGYSFPEAVAKTIGAGAIRLTLSGQNLFTWHHLTTDEYGPEGNYMSIPVYKLYSIGLSVKF
jgi:TonB-linked SusC/RagA family outer membrane protein